MGKRPKVTIVTSTTVRAEFGRRKPTFLDLERVAVDRPHLTDYEVEVFDVNAPTLTRFGPEPPSWVAKFTKRTVE